MLTGSAVVVVIFLFFVFFIYYKRDMFAKMFTIHANEPANELQEQLNQTADIIIKRLETELSHLEYLLEEAEIKSALLEKQLFAAEHILKTMMITETKPEATEVSAQSLNSLSTATATEEYQPVPRDSTSLEKKSLVTAMADQGYTITEIAKSTGMGKGEIMLLLHLHKK